MPMNDASYEVRAYLAVLRRQWRLGVAVAALVLVATLLNTWRQGPTYTSQAEVLVEPVALQADDFARPADLNMDDEQRVATSAEVTNRAAMALGEPSIIVEQISVEATPTAHTLLFTATASRPAEAQRIAQAFVASYLEVRTDQFKGILRAATKSLRTRLGHIQVQIDGLRGQIERLPIDAIEREGLQAQLSSLLTSRSTVQESLDAFISEEDLRVGEILTPASYPRSPSSSEPVKTGAFALFVGFALGIGIAFVRERLDPRVHEQGELETLLGAPVLGAIPKPRSPKRWPMVLRRRSRRPDKTAPQVIGLTDVDPAVDAAYKRLSRRLMTAAGQQQLTNLVVTSSDDGPGSTLTTAHLGAALAKAGKSVMLVSAEPERPRLEHYFAIENGNGSSAVARDPTSLEEMATDPASTAHLWSQLWVLQANLSLLLLPPDSLDPLDTELASRLMSEMRQTADLVLIETPPILEAPDAWGLVGLADGVLLVADAERTTRTSIVEAKYQLEEANALVVGAVLTNASRESHDRSVTSLTILTRR